MARVLLFVRGAGASGNAAIRLVRALELALEVEVIDVFQQPDVAEHYGVVATPTLVKVEPAPHRRLVGNITKQRVLECLS